MKAVTPGNRPGDFLFENVTLECASLEDVQQMLDQIAKNVQEAINSRSFETTTANPHAIEPSIQPYIKDRLIKVGTKRFTPTYQRTQLKSYSFKAPVATSFKESSDRTSKNQSSQDCPFNWEEFKHYQQEFLHKINKQLTGLERKDDFNKNMAQYKKNLQNQPSSSNQKPLNIEQKSSKLFLYKDWQYYYDENFPNQYKLVARTQNDDRYILVKFHQENNRVAVSTKKNNFNDPEIVAIMLEISRNAQRFAGSHEENVKVHGLNKNSPNDNQKIMQFKLLADTLNQGINSSKDEEKKTFNFDIPD